MGKVWKVWTTDQAFSGFPTVTSILDRSSQK
jgi:hypothetical protein